MDIEWWLLHCRLGRLISDYILKTEGDDLIPFRVPLLPNMGFSSTIALLALVASGHAHTIFQVGFHIVLVRVISIDPFYRRFMSTVWIKGISRASVCQTMMGYSYPYEPIDGNVSDVCCPSL